MDAVFLELSLVVIVVLVVSALMKLLRQPLLIGYIIAGVLVGPLAFNIVHAADSLDVFAHLGITLLLFIIGLGLSPRVIKDVGKAATLTGVLQVVFTTAVGWLIVKSLGYDSVVALYVAIALAFSSTIIVLKLLSDKKEHNRLYAKISVGFLLVQDICAALILIAITSANNDFSADLLYELIGKGLLLISGLVLFSAYVLPKLRNFISSQQEFLFIFSLAWGLGVGALFSVSGFSLEVGALAAGVALANQPYASEASYRLKPLRDFFIVMFFVSLGAALQLSALSGILPYALLLSLFVLIGNPIIVMIIMGLLGFTKKTGFKAGLAVAQISEFSLIFIALATGSLSDSLSQEIKGLVTLIALITIAASSYMIVYSDKLYNLLSPLLGVFERRKVSEQKVRRQPEMLLIGYTKGGEQFLKAFQSLKKPYLVVDYNPSIIEHLEQNNLPHTYGDISDIELMDELGLDKTKLVISTVHEFSTNKFIASYLTDKNALAIFICSADTPQQARELYQVGAVYVMLPHYIGGEKILSFIKKVGIDKQAFTKFRDQHLSHITQNLMPQPSSDEKHGIGKLLKRHKKKSL